MSKPTKKLIIIDGNALIHRSFHALPPTMATKKGEMVNAVYGFTTALLKAIKEFKPEFVVLTLDKKGPTFRHVEYKEYKATRVKAPDELYGQIPRVKEVARAFNIPIFEMSGLEADDLIGTIAKAVDGKVEKIILTGDLDTLQLVNEHTKVYTMSRGLSESVIYDEAAVKERYGLMPAQMIDYKALRGDPSDNIPGVRGIGEKTAIDLLKEFKTLEKVYEYVEKLSARGGSASGGKVHKVIKSKIKERIVGLLVEHKKDAFLSKKLATIKRDAEIDFKLEDAAFGDFDKAEVVKILSELEFKSLLPRIQEIGRRDEALPRLGVAEDKFERNKKLFKYILVDDDKKFKAFFNLLKKQGEFTFDTETSSLDPLVSELLGVSFSWKEGIAYYVVMAKRSVLDATAVASKTLRGEGDNLFNYKNNKKTEPSSEASKISFAASKWLSELKPILEDEKIKKFGHNIKFDMKVMRANGVNVKGVSFDTMIASYLLNPGTRQHNLDAVVFSELGFEKISKEDLLGKGKDKIGFAQVETEKLSLYSCEDADFTNRLVNKLGEELKKQKLDKLFAEMEMPLVSVLAEMENYGIKVDLKFLAKMEKDVSGKIKKLEEKIIELAGVNFNINSTQQLREILFEKLEIPTHEIGRTKTGFSTASEELEKLKDLHPIIKFIQEYRELNKLSNTYIDALPGLVNKKTGRLHTSFNQTITATGRLSSSEPNLQNIPIRTELGREIRKAFVADSGYKLVSLDYSQIELRLAAHMSGDAKMIKAFKDGVDIHTATAAEINRVALKDVTYNMRREAKAINFGILYGQGPHGLSRGADISYTRAREFIDEYFKAYAGIKKFVENCISEAREKGYAETMFGRRRYLPEINSSVLQVRKGAERMAINTPLQGTAADMIKEAMIEVSRNLTPSSPDASGSDTPLPPPPTPPIQEGGVRRGEGGEDIRMLLQVHDELVFEIKNDKVEEAVGEIKKIMENVIKLKVPVVVDASAGDNWGEMESISN
jgi:DNA polymerase-1